MSTEIEKRTLPNPDQRLVMIELIRTGSDFKEFDRIMIENASLDRTQTVRVRIDDGVMAIAVKDGTLDQEIRREAELVLDVSQPLEEVLHFLALLGHPNVSIGRRHVYAGTVGEFSLSLRDILSVDGATKLDCMMEVETKLGEGEAEEAALARIENFLREHSLKPLEGDEWIAWVRHNHAVIHTDFAYSPEAAKQLAANLRQ